MMSACPERCDRSGVLSRHDGHDRIPEHCHSCVSRDEHGYLAENSHGGLAVAGGIRTRMRVVAEALRAYPKTQACPKDADGAERRPPFFIITCFLITHPGGRSSATPSGHGVRGSFADSLVILSRTFGPQDQTCRNRTCGPPHRFRAPASATAPDTRHRWIFPGCAPGRPAARGQ